MGRRTRLLITVGALCGSIVLFGCATGSTFVPYPEQAREVRSAIGYGSAGLVAFPKKTARGPNALLYHLENGRQAQVSGLRDESLAHYELAIELIQAGEFQPWISVTDTGRQGSSLLLNDNTLLYRGEGYEHIFLHTFQALNYLMAGEIESAAVEARRTSAVQTRLLKQHEAELEKLERQRAVPPPIDIDAQANWQSQFALTDAAAARVKSVYQIAYSYYITALIFDLAGYPDHAYIDYKRAFELVPDSTVLQQSILRLARILGHYEDAEALEARGVQPPAPLPADEGELIVLYEQGFVPEKQEVGLTFYWQGRLLRLAFPIYEHSVTDANPLWIKTRSEPVTPTETLTEVSALAAKTMQEKRWSMLVRQVARLIAKDKLYRESEQEAGPLGAFFANVYNLVSEQPDLRSWLTLPATAQVATLRLPQGEHEIALASDDGADTIVPVVVEPGARTVMHVVKAGARYHITQTQIRGGRL